MQDNLDLYGDRQQIRQRIEEGNMLQQTNARKENERAHDCHDADFMSKCETFKTSGFPLLSPDDLIRVLLRSGNHSLRTNPRRISDLIMTEMGSDTRDIFDLGVACLRCAKEIEIRQIHSENIPEATSFAFLSERDRNATNFAKYKQSFDSQFSFLSTLPEDFDPNNFKVRTEGPKMCYLLELPVIRLEGSVNRTDSNHKAKYKICAHRENQSWFLDPISEWRECIQGGIACTL